MARSKFAGDKKMSEDNIENQESIPVKLILERIILKDASFESPSSPSIFETVHGDPLKTHSNVGATMFSFIASSTGVESSEFVARLMRVSGPKS